MTETGANFEIILPHQLASFIDERKMDIVAYFLSEARRRVPAAADKSTSFVLDHLPKVLEAMADFIRGDGNSEAKNRAIRFARLHAKERLTGSRYSPEQIREEYAIVREGILSLIGESTLLNHRSLTLFSHVCELTLAVVIEEFVEGRENPASATELASASEVGTAAAPAATLASASTGLGAK